MRRVWNQDESQLASQMKRKLDKLDWLKPVYDKMVAICNEMLQMPENWLDECLGTTARKIGGKIGALYTTWLLTQNPRYLEQAVRILDQAVAKDADYYYGLNGHLSMGDAVLAISMSYNFLAEHLTEKQRADCEARLGQLADWLHKTDCTWGLEQPGVTSCNHNCVHYGALGLCGLILEKDEWLEHGLRRVRAFLKEASDKTGYFTEGLSYLNYGNMTAILFCESYKQIFGEQIYDKPDTINQVIAHMLPMPGQVLKLNDHGKSVENMLPQVYLANRYHHAGAMYLINQYEEAIGEYFSDWKMDMSGGFVYPFIYLFADEDLVPKKPSVCDVPKTQIFESGRVMTRTQWDDPMAYHFSVSCGHCFHYGHNHADKGSFTIYGNGESFLVDIGARSNEDRAHNILMINGVGQPKGRSRGEILEVRDTEEYLFVCCDTTRSYIYTPDTLVGMALRNIMFVKKPFPMVIIRDDVQLERPLEENQKYEFLIHTEKNNRFEIQDQSIQIIGQNFGNRCRLSFVNPPNVEICVSKENRMNYSYRQPVYSGDLFEEAIATCYGYNPYLTTVITFADKEKSYPEVSISGDPMHLVVEAEQEDKSRAVQLSRYTMTVVK